MSRCSTHSRFALALTASLLPLASPAAGRSADVILDPGAQAVNIGSIVEVRITLSGSAGQPQSFDAMDVIFSWDPAVLDLLSASQVGADYSFFASGFLPNPDGLNLNLDDGLVMWTGLGPPGSPQVAPPSPQMKVATTLRFQTLTRTPLTAVEIVPSFGVFSLTRVLLNGVNVTGSVASSAFITVVTPLPCPAAGSCFVSHPTPGCDDAGCCQIVCTVDALCCVDGWDAACVDEAFELCNGCGDPATGDCCTPHGTPFCSDLTCCELVCLIDSFCCDSSWDSLCVGEAAAIPACGCDPCETSSESCYVPHSSPGCDDPTCCAAICALDSFCCETSWDQLCKDAANELCAGCGAPSAGSCYCQHAGPGCDQAACCRTVCESDPFCCESEWDSICVSEALSLCGCPADFNGDGTVDGADLGLLLAEWGTSNCPFDLNGADGVDGADLGILLAAWGPCP